MQDISHNFLVPLHDLLTSTQAHCRNEAKIKHQELETAKISDESKSQDNYGKSGLKADEPTMSVQMLDGEVQMLDGEVLPEPSLKDQIQVSD